MESYTYNRPVEGNCIVDVALGADKFNTAALKWRNGDKLSPIMTTLISRKVRRRQIKPNNICIEILPLFQPIAVVFFFVDSLHIERTEVLPAGPAIIAILP